MQVPRKDISPLPPLSQQSVGVFYEYEKVHKH